MNRVQEKVNDIVEVRSNLVLNDFAADPSQTLAGYHFTDITADLMAKWIDRVVVMPDENGHAFALAGFRGVGKSHFLAAFGAILAKPELRSRIKDSHVYASAERLIRRHYPIAYVRRGTKDHLIEELQSGIGQLFEIAPEQVGGTPQEIIETITDRGGAGPVIVVIDTALERQARVSRDDGPFLSELAEAAKNKNIFIGIALDDDIAGADGRNSAIVSSYTIDYLDNEHLYKIIDAYIFPKHPLKRKALFEIYEDLRKVLPGFRWSEQRFSSVYPLHPVALEVAPFIRLHVQDFALLTFASETGEKILTRPADSLIGLDELFDVVEKDLRNAADLDELFSVYDELNAKVVSKIPVMQRLKAKLVLKALMLLSLNGEGVTAGDIAAAMLIYDERDALTAVAFVEDLLAQFAATAGKGIWTLEQEGRSPKYGFRLSGNENLESALADTLSSIPEEVVPDVLRRLMQERFDGGVFVELKGEAFAVDAEIEWRGSVRRGRVIWDLGGESVINADESEGTEWQAFIEFDRSISEKAAGSKSIRWVVDPLKREEIDSIRRYHALMSRTDLQEQFRDQIGSIIQAQTIAIEKIWDRKFIQYGKIVIDGDERPFSTSAMSALTLSDLFAELLDPFFANRYPDHPEFSSVLTLDSVSALGAGLFAGNVRRDSDIGLLAQSYALPLGVITSDGELMAPVAAEELKTHTIASAVLRLSKIAGGEMIPMDEVSSILSAQPFGLTIEARRLILIALVAQRLIEFVTPSGDRIGRRSLDLQIIWDDIVGIVGIDGQKYSTKKLCQWAALLTEDPQLSSIDTPAKLASVRAALETWLGKWKERRIFERLADLPDDLLNTKLWRLSSRAEKSFGTTSEVIGAFGDDQISIEEALQRIAEAFSDSEEQFLERRKELDVLDEFLTFTRLRADIKVYLAGCGPMGDRDLYELREKLSDEVESQEEWPRKMKAPQLEELWMGFLAAYIDRTAAAHESLRSSTALRDKLDEIFTSAEWWEFENLSGIDVFPREYSIETQRLLRKRRSLTCKADVQEMLARRPFCSCGFTLASIEEAENLPYHLLQTVKAGLHAYRLRLVQLKSEIVTRANELSGSIREDEPKSSLDRLIDHLVSGKQLQPFSDTEIKWIGILVAGMSPPDPTSIPLAVVTPESDEIELPSDAVEWVEDHSDEGIVIKV